MYTFADVNVVLTATHNAEVNVSYIFSIKTKD